MNHDGSTKNSGAAPRLKSAIVRELLGHLILLVPMALILCAGLLVARVVRAHFDREESAVSRPLSQAVAMTKLEECPVLKGDRILDITGIQPRSAVDREVEYTYRDARHPNISGGTAEFSWSHGQWHAVLCR